MEVDTGRDNPFHSVVRQSRPDKEKMELLITFMTFTPVDINAHGEGGMTALHYAVQVCV